MSSSKCHRQMDGFLSLEVIQRIKIRRAASHEIGGNYAGESYARDHKCGVLPENKLQDLECCSEQTCPCGGLSQ